MLAEGKDVILSTGEFDFLMEDVEHCAELGLSYPKRIVIKIPHSLEVVLQVEELLESEDMLEDLFPAVKVLLKSLLRLNPGYFRARSKCTIRKINNEEIVCLEVGTALHEIVVFRKSD